MRRHWQKLRLRGIFIAVNCILCSQADCAIAASVSCIKAPIKIGFFNGVWNTEDDAAAGATALRLNFDGSYLGRPVSYDYFFNQTGKGGADGSTLFEDLAEVFIQRADELDSTQTLSHHWEAFWEAQNGGGSFLSAVRAFFTNAAGVLDALYQDIIGHVAGYSAAMLSNPPTQADTGLQKAKLSDSIANNELLVLVAHSQGNLFVNPAYEYLASNNYADKTAVVHIAPATNNMPPDRQYTLFGYDLVINALRLTGINSVPDINAWDNPSASDFSGHQLVPTYLDTARDPFTEVSAQVRASMDKVIAADDRSVFTIESTQPNNISISFAPVSVPNSAPFAGSGGNWLPTFNAAAGNFVEPCADDGSTATGTFSVDVIDPAFRNVPVVETISIKTRDGVVASRDIVLPISTAQNPGQSNFSVFDVVVTKNSDGTYGVEVQ